MKLIWYTVLIRAIPEALGVVILALALTKEKARAKNVLLASILCGLIAFIMRMLPLKFGIHALITVILQTFIINTILKIKIQNAFKGILLSMILLATSELLTIIFIRYAMGLNPEDVYSSVSGIILSGLPSVLILYIVAFLIFKLYKKTL